MSPRDLLLTMFRAAVDAASPARCLPAHLPPPPLGRTVVVGAGKAAAAMARVVEERWPAPVSGLVITPYGHAVRCERIEVVEAAHPMPDESGVAAALRVRNLISNLTTDDLVLCLLSGGGSSLLAAPAGEVTLTEKRDVTRQLLLSGATIAEINCIRKHLSAIKGGRLALMAHPAHVVSLTISDVAGDDPSVIASGPTVPDASTREEALHIAQRYAVQLPRAARKWLESPASETPKPGDARFSHVRNVVVATARKSLSAAAECARRDGVAPLILGDAIEGEARGVARIQADIVRGCITQGAPVTPPCVLISGGETTVTVRGAGRGGRNTEFLLALAMNLEHERRVWAIACDTDGLDGAQDNAGAILSPGAVERARARGADPAASLQSNDSHAVFEALDELVMTGPTRTNVNDFRAILIL